jgi:hypothetical protein
MKKSQNKSVWLNKMVLAQHFCTLFLRLVRNRRSKKPNTLQLEKTAIKTHGLIAPLCVSDWSIIIIRPGALLVLVVSHPLTYLQSQF